MKELPTLLSQNSNFMRDVVPERVRAHRHLIFTARSDDDPITIPVCGDVKNSIVATRKLHGVTCPECLEHCIALASMDTYADALAYVTSFAPKILQPDPDIMKLTHAGQPTIEAEKHLLAKQFLDMKQLERAEDLPLNIIGTQKGLYFFNMIELLLIDSENGEPVQATIDELQERLDGISSE